MTSPYQSSVVGASQTIPLVLPPSAALHITSIPDWASYRWIIQPLYGTVGSGLTYIHEADAAAAQSIGGVYDSGWWQSNTHGYSAGDTVAPGDVYSASWWTSRSLVVPVTRNGPAILPASIPLGPGCTGIKVTSFVYFGGFDAVTQDIVFKTSNAAGLSLTAIDNGYFQDTTTGKVYRSSWQAPYTNNPSNPNALSLQTIVSRIAKRGGLSTSDYEAGDYLSTLVAGYPIARQSNAADCLLPLLQAYFGYASEYDSQLHFKFYGANAGVTVDRADLIEGNEANPIVSNLRNQATEFPRRVVASYMDPAQNYSVVDVAAERRAIDVIAIGDQSLQIPVVMAANDAAKAADKALKVTYASLEGTQEYSAPFAGSDVYLSLAAGEPVVFQGKRYIADEMILGSGSIKLTTRYDRQSAYTSNVQAIPGNAPIPPSSQYSGPTTIIPMNLAAQRPQDSVGVYIAAASTDGRDDWRGCTVQASYDGMSSWQNVLTITAESTIGTVDLAATANSEPITVTTVKYDLESATTAQLQAQANVFAVVAASDVTRTAQLGQFATATDTVNAHQAQLTTVARAIGGTTAKPLSPGDSFTLMDSAYFLPIDPSFLGRTLYFRGVGFGEVADDAVIVPLVYAAFLQVPGQLRTAEDGTIRVTEDGTTQRSTEQ